LPNKLDHLNLVSVSKNGKREDEIELQTTIRDCEVTNPIRIELGTIAIVVHEVGPRITAATFFNGLTVQVDAPVVFLVNVVAGARQQPSDVAAEIQDLTASPNRMGQHSIEVSELRHSSRDRTPCKRASQEQYLATNQRICESAGKINLLV